jgi:putative membrane protein
MEMIKNYTDHSANERTFLAWVRTAVAIVGFGLASARLGGQRVDVWSEVLMLATGGLVILIAFLKMRHMNKRISSTEMLDQNDLPTDTLLLLLVASLFALLAFFVLHVG